MKALTAPICLALLALTACAPERGFPPIDSFEPLGEATGFPAPTPAEAASVATCAGTDILSLVGQNVSKLPATGTWSTVRILKPGSMMTTDFSPTRLNVGTDNSGTILQIYCG